MCTQRPWHLKIRSWFCRSEVRRESPAFLEKTKAPRWCPCCQLVDPEHSVCYLWTSCAFTSRISRLREKTCSELPVADSRWERASSWPLTLSSYSASMKCGHSKKQALLFRRKNMCLRSLQKFCPSVLQVGILEAKYHLFYLEGRARVIKSWAEEPEQNSACESKANKTCL